MGWDDDYYEEYDDTTAFDASDQLHGIRQSEHWFSVSKMLLNIWA